MNVLPYLNFVGILLTLLVVVVLWIDLRRAASETKRLLRTVLWRLRSQSDHHAPFIPPPIAEYGIWKWKKEGQDGEGTWEIERQPAAPEFELGPPPARKGWYDGEVVRTQGIRKGERV